MTSTVMKMFPLGSVLFPHGLLPLRIFEARYLQMMRECTAAGGEFGVVLIEKGSEVGGGDLRTSVGTAARILEVTELDEGQVGVIAIGDRRITVEAWLPDAPYPQAFVIDNPPLPSSGEERALVTSVETGLRRVYALYSELGVNIGSRDLTLADDPHAAAFQACALSPITAFDAQRLLELPATDDRLSELTAVLADHVEMLEMRLAAG